MILYYLGPAGFTHKNVLTFLRGPNKPRDDMFFNIFYNIIKTPAIAGVFILFTQTQFFNQGFVIRRIAFLDIGQQFFTTVNH